MVFEVLKREYLAGAKHVAKVCYKYQTLGYALAICEGWGNVWKRIVCLFSAIQQRNLDSLSDFRNLCLYI